MFNVLQVSTGYSDGTLEAKCIRDAGGSHSMIASQRTEDILEAGQRADALIVTLTQVTAELMEGLPRLKHIVRAGIGVDNIDLEAAKARGIAVYNLPHYCQDEVADHTVAMILALERNLYTQVRDIKMGMWKAAKAYGPICGMRGTTVGLLGCGGIARLVAKRLIPFGARLVGHDPYLSAEVVAEAGIQLIELDELFKQADYLSLHLPLTKDTRHIIDTAAFEKMKRNAYLINSARGPLVDNEALLVALTSGKLGGAALDVIEGDLEEAKRFAPFDHVLITPHSAYYSLQAEQQICYQAGELLAAVIRGQYPNNRIV